MKNILLIILVIFPYFIFSQSINGSKGSSDIIQNSGKAIFSYPITSIQDRGVAANISIQNVVDGIKVNERSESVGLGWNLQQGAYISRIKQGQFHDENKSRRWFRIFLEAHHAGISTDLFPEFNYTGTFGVLLDYINLLNITQYLQYGYFDYLENKDDIIEHCDKSWRHCEIDFETDLYYFNVEGYSGTFFFDNDGNIRFNNTNDLKIDYKILTKNHTLDFLDQDHIVGWKITLPNGNIYTLGDYEANEWESEYTEYSSYHTTIDKLNLEWHRIYSSKWHVANIKSLDGEITYSYDNENYITETNAAHIEFVNFDEAEDEYRKQETQKNKVFGKRLNRIESAFNVVNLVYGDTRKNMETFENSSPTLLETPSPYQPSLISDIYTYIKNSNSDKLLRHIHLDYEEIDLGIHERSFRYILKSISEVANTDDILKTEFEYYNLQNLVPHDSYAKDLWGYNNGVTNNTSDFYCPKVNIPCVQSLKGTRSQNRSINIDYTLAGSLKNVIYPTGRKEEFILESNTVFKELVDYEKLETLHDFEVAGFCESSCTDKTYTIDNFIMDENYEYEFVVNKISTCNDPYINESKIECYQIDNNNTETYLGNISNKLFSKSSIESTLGLLPNISYKLRFKVQCISLSTDPTYPLDLYSFGDYNIKINKLPITNKNIDVGGLRIKEHKINDISTYYQYDFENERPNPAGNLIDTHELTICELCGKEGPGNNCGFGKDETEYLTINCEDDYSLNLIGNIKCAPPNTTGYVHIKFKAYDEGYTFQIDVPFEGSQNYNILYTKDELEAFGLVDGITYKIILHTSNTDEVQLTAKAFIHHNYYQYGDSSESLKSSGVLLQAPINLGIVSWNGDRIIDNECQKVPIYYLNVNFTNLFNSTIANEVVYSRIKSYQNEEVNGYSESHYHVKDEIINYNVIENIFDPVFPLYTTSRPKSHMYVKNDFSLLDKSELYDSKKNLVRSTKYEYNTTHIPIDLSYINYVFVCKEGIPLQYTLKKNPAIYNLFQSDIRIKNIEVEEDGLKVVTSYEYDPDHRHHMPTKITTFNKAFPDDKIEKTTVYSTHYPSYDNILTNRNIIVPCETYINGGNGGGTKSIFKLVNYKPRLTKVLNLEYDAENNTKNWIEVSENINYNSFGEVTETWSKTSSQNMFYTFEEGLLISERHGNARQTTYEYDDYRRLYKTIDPLGITTLITEYDGFHRVKEKKLNGLNNSFDVVQNYTYHIDIQNDDYVETKTSYPNDNYDIGVHHSKQLFDVFGRNHKNINYSYTQDNSDYKTNKKYDALGRLSESFAPGNGGTSIQKYDNTPRNRVIRSRQGNAPKFVHYKYGSEVTDMTPNGRFIKRAVIDENGNETKTYRTIDNKLKIVVDALGNQTTYTYNDRGDIIKVKNPNGEEYTYEYDNYGRLTSKTIPNKGQYTYLYNGYEQIRYESFPGGNLQYFYNNTYNDFLQEVKKDGSETIKRYKPYDPDLKTSRIGEEKIKVLPSGAFLTNTFTYDEFGRLKKSNIQHLDKSSSYSYQYDALDNVRRENRVFDGKNINTTYNYDKGLRLFEIYKELPDIVGEKLIQRNYYDNRDWLVYKNQGGLFAEHYGYTPNGWLRSINNVQHISPKDPNCGIKPTNEFDVCFNVEKEQSPFPTYEDNQPKADLFALELKRTLKSSLSAPAQYNGNISWMRWVVQDELVQEYGFKYDKINRLRQGRYRAEDRPNCKFEMQGAYDVDYKYDAIGNFTTVKRKGVIKSDGDDYEYGLIDNLDFEEYNGSQLTKIKDLADNKKGFKGTNGALKYKNGNLISHEASGISSITYNFMDLPTKVVTKDQVVIEFVYDANGTQHSMTITANGVSNTTNYYDGIEYQNGTLQSIFHEEGRAVYNQPLDGVNNYPYLEWNIVDHLGNVRVRYVDKDNDGNIFVKKDDPILNEIIGSTHYYPFGLATEGPWHKQEGAKNRYKYNGIEHVDEVISGLSFSSYRIHDAALGRWYQVDPKAEATYHLTPFGAMNQNPVSFTDPNGDIALATIAAGAGIGAAVGILGNGFTNLVNGDPFFQGAGQAAIYGAIGGALGVAGGGTLLQAGISVASSYLPSYNVYLGGGFALSVSPGIMFGSQGAMLGLNIGLSYTSGNFSLGVSGNLAYGKSNITGKNGLSGLIGARAAFDNGKFYASLGSTRYFSGSTSQRTGTIGLGAGGIKLHYENDYHYGLTEVGLSDNGDRYRTAAMRISYGDFEAGFTLFTGDPGPSGVRQEFVQEIDGYETYIGNDKYKPDQFRFGAAYVGYKGYRAGWNNEGIRHVIQNRVAHDMITRGSSKHFRRMPSGYPGSFYGGSYQTNTYSLWQ